jgi:nuclear pore complex protein Nup188
MFNLNWSMLDADIALTKAFHSLVERISYWTQGDGLSATACLKASITVAELLATEDRGGDVMLAVQTQRLELLAAMLETALDTENDQTETPLLQELLGGFKRIIENSSFPPISSLRHADQSTLHRPVLRILFLVFQSLAAHPKTDLSVDTLLDDAIVFLIEAADIILDSVLRGHDCAGDLGLVIGSLCGMVKIVSTPVWIDKMSETNLIGRTLEIITRTKVFGTTAANSNGPVSFVPSQIPLVLLFHLALATNPLSAEKLAVSGGLSAYSDNGIALSAENAQIVAPIETAPYTVHGSWYSMLLVVKALLCSLQDTHSFVKSDVTPFIRVGTEQMLKALTWTGETAMTTSALDEMQVTLDIFYGISQEVSGGSDGILSSIGTPLVELLRGMREAFEHPLELSQTIVPSSEEEHHALGDELDVLANMQAGIDLVALLDQTRVPVVAARVERLLRVTMTALMTLLNLTRVWPALKEGERLEETVLQSEVSLMIPSRDVADVQDELVSSQSDPVTILNDLANTVSTLLDRSPATTSARPLLYTTLELCTMLSTAQILTRHAMFPEDTSDDMDVKMTDEKTRRTSLGNGGVLKELVGDLMTVLGGEEAGAEGVLGWLRKLVWRTFEQAE